MLAVIHLFVSYYDNGIDINLSSRKYLPVLYMEIVCGFFSFINYFDINCHDKPISAIYDEHNVVDMVIRYISILRCYTVYVVDIIGVKELIDYDKSES